MKKDLLALLAFGVFFCSIFSVFLIENVLPGSTDSLGHIAILHDHFTDMHNLFSSDKWGYAFYPEKGVGQYSESYLFEAIVFLMCRGVGMNDIWASWLLVVVLYTLNACAVFKLNYHYTKNHWAAFVSGLCFSASAFMLGNIELLNSLGFFPVPFSLLYLEKYAASGKCSMLFTSILILGTTHFVSGYAFLFGLLLWCWLVVYRRPNVSMLSFFIAIFLFLMCVIPFGFQLANIRSSEVYNPVVDIPNSMERFSLGVHSLISSLPNNLIYPQQTALFTDEAVKIPYYANAGFLFATLLILAMFTPRCRNWFYIVIVVAFAILSFGPTLHVWGNTYNLPLFYLKEIPLVETFFRIPGRAFVVAQFGMSMMVGFIVSVILEKMGSRQGLAFLILVSTIFVLENVPMPMTTPKQKSRLTLPKIYDSLPDSVCNLAILPSSIFAGSGYVNGISEFSREYHYQYWQTKHRHNIVNGSSSYFPKSRMENNDLLINLSDNGNLDSLIDRNALDFIVLHEYLVMNAKEKDLLPFLQTKAHRLRLKLVVDGSYLFERK